MMNVFSSFNPTNFVILTFMLINFYLSYHLLTLMMQKKFYKVSSVLLMSMNDSMNKNNNSNLSLNTILCIFFFMLLMNLLNLNSFSFCLNSQLNLFFFFSMIMWFSCLLFSINYFMKNLLIHMTPMGCPTQLSFVMVLIEFISMIIRPLTLSVRMSANMLAGHLLIHLLTEFSFFLYNSVNLSILFSFSILILLNILEISVSLIQPYIFCTLLNMYLCENK